MSMIDEGHNRYATDGLCHNAELGTFNHECGRLATWIGVSKTGFRSGFCNDCKLRGYEARDVVRWEHLDATAVMPAATERADRPA